MNDPRRVAVLGAGGHAKVVIASLTAAGRQIAGLYDDHPATHGTWVLGHRVLGSIDSVGEGDDMTAVIAIGNPNARRRIARGLKRPGAIVVHPRAVVDPSVQIGEGTVVFAGAVVQPDSRLGRHVIVNSGAIVDHDCRAADFSHIAPGTRLGGGVDVGRGVLVGIGATVMPYILIGDDSVVGAGAVVTRNVGAGRVVIGVPATPYSRAPETDDEPQQEEES